MFSAAACGGADALKPLPLGARIEGEARAELPTWTVGDSWVFDSTSYRTGHTRSVQVVSALAEYDGVPAYKLDVSHARTDVRRAATATGVRFVTQGGLGFMATMADARLVRHITPARDFQFPLEVGKKWSARVHDEVRTTQRGGEQDYAEHFTVENCENVTVPAGTFAAFKIVRHSGKDAFSEYWYAPAAKTVVKHRNADVWDRGEEELVELHLAAR